MAGHHRDSDDPRARYFGLDDSVIGSVVTNDIPTLRKQLEAIRRRLDENRSR